MAPRLTEVFLLESPLDNDIRRLGAEGLPLRVGMSMILVHLRVPRGPAGGGFKSQEALDAELPLTLALRPQVPRGDPGTEDRTTPRVSLARKVAGAAGSLGLGTTNSTGRPVGVYRPEMPIEFVEPLDRPAGPDNLFYVHDARKHGEVWALRPVRVERVRVVMPGEKF